MIARYANEFMNNTHTNLHVNGMHRPAFPELPPSCLRSCWLSRYMIRILLLHFILFFVWEIVTIPMTSGSRSPHSFQSTRDRSAQAPQSAQGILTHIGH